MTGFFQGRRIRGTDVKDIMWLRTDGEEMNEADWESSWLHCFGVFLDGDMPDEIDQQGERVSGDTLLILMNAYYQPIDFRLPAAIANDHWVVRIDTATGFVDSGEAPRLQPGGTLRLLDRSLVVLSLKQPG